MSTHTLGQAHIHTHTHTHTHTHEFTSSHTRTHTHTHTHVSSHPLTHACTHTCTHARTHMHTQSHYFFSSTNIISTALFTRNQNPWQTLLRNRLELKWTSWLLQYHLSLKISSSLTHRHSGAPWPQAPCRMVWQTCTRHLASTGTHHLNNIGQYLTSHYTLSWTLVYPYSLYSLQVSLYGLHLSSECRNDFCACISATAHAPVPIRQCCMAAWMVTGTRKMVWNIDNG